MTDSKTDQPGLTKTDKKVTSIQPVREYQVPGGPTAKNLGRTEVKVLAEFERGGASDMSANRDR